MNEDYQDFVNLTHEVVTTFSSVRRQRRVSQWTTWSFGGSLYTRPEEVKAVMETIGWRPKGKTRSTRYRAVRAFVMTQPTGGVLYIKEAYSYIMNMYVTTAITMRKSRKGETP